MCAHQQEVRSWTTRRQAGNGQLREPVAVSSTVFLAINQSTKHLLKAIYFVIE